MAKKKKAVKDGKHSVLVDGKDQKRLAELMQAAESLQTNLQANNKTVGVILKDYAHKGEQVVSYDKATGLASMQKPVRPPVPPVPPKEPKKKE